ncbi:putative kinesin-like protein [Trypanosoma theileri]|uniref:Kinesin-like protein n=1 Tax=Trypanosoma theileri TaxID=67003 RepID=A0A1X0P9H3_9TRYP|nr:putative kinesin-like protein [Trypanosoma theileri]ORC93574.1 putative kinesin-like protein [Trypanosoma theileri]
MSREPQSAVRVVVRCRPLLSGEQDHTCSCIKLDAENAKVLVTGKNQEESRCFAFDRVFPPETQQEEVADEVLPLIDHVLNGFHATVFAYGQTGSGKTYTVDGIDYLQKGTSNLQPNTKTDPKQHGIIPRVIQLIFDRVRQLQMEDEHARFQLRCSFYQIYNERVTDLLNPSTTQALGSGLKIGWRSGDVFSVENLFLCECDHPEKMRRVFLSGAREKVMASHAMNRQSSRSHTVFTIYVTRRDTDSPEMSVRSEFSIVDLAGSEKLTMLSRDPSASLVKESIEINASLLALGKVITALANASKAKGKKGAVFDRLHIPYRDSKLTKLLKHALGGNSLTTMFACINPSDRYVDETLSTLLYAGRARNITNVPKVNEDPKNALIRQLRAEVDSMKKELAYYRGLASGNIDKMESVSTQSNQSLGGKADSEQVILLTDKLLQACESLKSIITVNAQLRDAFDTVKDARSELEKREVELNAENLALRERIEMLESIVLKDGFIDSGSGKVDTLEDIDDTPVPLSTRRKDSQVTEKMKSMLEQPLMRDESCQSPDPLSVKNPLQQNKRSDSRSSRRTSSQKRSVVGEINTTVPPSNNERSSANMGERNSGGHSFVPVEKTNHKDERKQRKQKKEKHRRSALAEKLEEYTNRYYKPNHVVNYAEYYGKARQQVVVNRTATTVIKEMEKTLKHLPPSIADGVPQSLKLISQFGALSFGGAREEVSDLEQRRKQREEKRNALLAQQQALLGNVARAFADATVQLDAVRYGSASAFSSPSAGMTTSISRSSAAIAFRPYSDTSSRRPRRPVRSQTPPAIPRLSTPIITGSCGTSRLRAYLDHDEAMMSKAPSSGNIYDILRKTARTPSSMY